jgi:hypothetical protein
MIEQPTFRLIPDKPEVKRVSIPVFEFILDGLAKIEGFNAHIAINESIPIVRVDEDSTC